MLPNSEQVLPVFFSSWYWYKVLPPTILTSTLAEKKPRPSVDFLHYFTVRVPETQHFHLNLCQPVLYYSRATLFIPNVAQWYSKTFTVLRFPRHCLHFLWLFFSSWHVCCGRSLCLFPGSERSEQRNYKKWAHSVLVVWHHFHMDIWGQSRSWTKAGEAQVFERLS